MGKPNLPYLQDIRDNLDGIKRICQDYNIAMPDMIHLMIVHELREIRRLLVKMDKHSDSVRLSGDDATSK